MGNSRLHACRLKAGWGARRTMPRIAHGYPKEHCTDAHCVGRKHTGWRHPSGRHRADRDAKARGTRGGAERMPTVSRPGIDPAHSVFRISDRGPCADGGESVRGEVDRTGPGAGHESL